MLGWDQQVMMPPRGAPVRAEQLATLGRIAHEKFISPEIGRLLDELDGFEAEHDYDSFEASLIRVTRDDCEKARKVPAELRAEMSRARPRSRCRSGSRRARTTTSRAFLPALRENLELRRRYVACFEGDYAEPYDALLDDYERGMTTAEVRTLFDYLKEHQAPLVKQVADAEPRAGAGRRSVFPIELQKQFELEVVRRFGFDETALAARPDRASVRDRRRQRGHPDHDALLRATASTGSSRRCTRPATASTSTRSTARSTGRRSARGTSLGMHESQSRMWENLVGRSLPFWRFFFPRLQRDASRRRSPATTSSAGTARSTPSGPR